MSRAVPFTPLSGFLIATLCDRSAAPSQLRVLHQTFFPTELLFGWADYVLVYLLSMWNRYWND